MAKGGTDATGDWPGPAGWTRCRRSTGPAPNEALRDKLGFGDRQRV